jgi:hypothetical protein
MNEEQKKQLTMILFMQSVAGARNVKPIERLEALHNDIGAMIQGEEPIKSKELVYG